MQTTKSWWYLRVLQKIHTSRRGSHVYEINTWLWNFGRPQPRVGGLSVAKTEKIRRKSRSEASKRGWATKKALKWPSHGICIVCTWHIPGLYLLYPVWQSIMPFECNQVVVLKCHAAHIYFQFIQHWLLLLELANIWNPHTSDISG